MFDSLLRDLWRSPIRPVPPRARRAERHAGGVGGAGAGGGLGLLDALDYLTLLAAEAPERFDRAARKWLARLLAESPAMTADEVAVAAGCLRGLPAGIEEQSREVLRALVKRRHETRGQ